jgi:putative inorganic carbon (hco3(-)) transporter
VSESQSRYELKAFFQGSLLSYLVGFYIFAFYLELHYRIPVLQTIRFQFVYGAIVGAYCLYANINSRQPTSGLNSVTKSALTLIFVLGIYTIFSMDRTESITVFSDRVVKFALVSFFIYAATRSLEDLRVIIAFMLLAWLKIGSEGFIGWVTGHLVWENQGIPRLHGSTFMFGHPNSFSGFAVGCLPYTVFLLMCSKNILVRLGLLVLLGFSLIIIMATGSRTGYLALVLGMIYFFFTLKRGKLKVLLVSIPIIIIALSFVPDSYKGRFESIFTGEEKEGHSSEARKNILREGWQIYLAYPMGVGVQAFSKVRIDMFGNAQNTHNLYLEVLTNIGPIGFIVFSVFVYHLIRKNIDNIHVIRARNSTTLPLNEHLLLNLSKATVGFIVMRLLLGLFGMDLYEIYWWIALGITLAITKLILLTAKDLQS